MSDIICFNHQNAEEYENALDELITQAIKDDIMLAVVLDMGIVLVEKLSIELGELFDKHGFVMQVKDEVFKSLGAKQ